MMEIADNDFEFEDDGRIIKIKTDNPGKYSTTQESDFDDPFMADWGQLSKLDGLKSEFKRSASRKFQKAYTAGQIRALVVQRLTKEAISEDSNPSVRVNALKALGTIAGVDAFVHRSETTVIKDSDKARAELMEMLKQSMADNARTVNQDDADIVELLAEINPPPMSIESESESDPLPHDSELGVPPADIHSIPHTESPSQSSSEVNEKNIEENQ